MKNLKISLLFITLFSIALGLNSCGGNSATTGEEHGDHSTENTEMKDAGHDQSDSEKEAKPDATEETTPTLTGNWEEPCTEDSDCVVNADYCVKMPGDTDGYCSTHCDSRTACAQAGAPESWTCNAVSCALPDFTWCGPPSEVADSGNFLSMCE